MASLHLTSAVRPHSCPRCAWRPPAAELQETSRALLEQQQAAPADGRPLSCSFQKTCHHSEARLDSLGSVLRGQLSAATLAYELQGWSSTPLWLVVVPVCAPLRRAAVRVSAKSPAPGSPDEPLKPEGEGGIIGGALQWPPKVLPPSPAGRCQHIWPARSALLVVTVATSCQLSAEAAVTLIKCILAKSWSGRSAMMHDSQGFTEHGTPHPEDDPTKPEGAEDKPRHPHTVKAPNSQFDKPGQGGTQQGGGGEGMSA